MRFSDASGVYCVFNKESGKRYIGSSIHIRRRWKEHVWKLRRGAHYNCHLQHSWSKHGPDAFVFIVLEYCCPSLLELAENRAIKAFQSHNRTFGYNVAPESRLSARSITDETRMKMRAAWVGRRPSDETIAAMLAAVKGRKQSQEQIARRLATRRSNGNMRNPPEAIARQAAKLRGRKLTDEHKQRMSDACRKLSYDDVRDACRLKVNKAPLDLIVALAKINKSTYTQMMRGAKGYSMAPQILREVCDENLAIALNRIHNESASTVAKGS